MEKQTINVASQQNATTPLTVAAPETDGNSITANRTASTAGESAAETEKAVIPGKPDITATAQGIVLGAPRITVHPVDAAVDEGVTDNVLFESKGKNPQHSLRWIAEKKKGRYAIPTGTVEIASRSIYFSNLSKKIITFVPCFFRM